MSNKIKYINCGAVIIARLKSKRLKKKALLKINENETIIEYIILKLKRLFKNQDIILATSHKSSDRKLILKAKQKNIGFYQGEAIDVIKRIYLAAKKKNFLNVFVCTADNPLFDLSLAQRMINHHINKKSDFTCYNGAPIGSYGWVLNVKKIKKVLETKKIKDTEIWGNLFLKNKKIKSSVLLRQNKSNSSILSKIRLTVDTIEDLKLVKQVLKISKVKYPSLKNVEKILLDNKYLIKINSKIKQRKAPRNIFVY